MNKANVLALARREAAASIKWPEKTALLLNPDPTIRKRLKKAAIFMGLLAVLWAVGSDPRGPVHEWTRSVENRQLRPAMESSFKAGNFAAGTWLAMHFPKDYPDLLQIESDLGEPTAMFIVGRMLYLDDHPERFLKTDRSLTAQQFHAEGLELIRRAAAAGNQEALLFVIQHGGTAFVANDSVRANGKGCSLHGVTITGSANVRCTQ